MSTTKKLLKIKSKGAIKLDMIFENTPGGPVSPAGPWGPETNEEDLTLQSMEINAVLDESSLLCVCKPHARMRPYTSNYIN